MKKTEITPCAVCGRRLMEKEGQFTWWSVTLVQEVADIEAIQRAHGLEMLLGPRLAAVMGTDEDLARPLENLTARICQDCVVSGASIGAVLEALRRKTPCTTT